MLNGFTKSGLVVYPITDDYVGRGMSYENKFNIAVSKLHEYFNKCNISYQCFVTDDVARILRDKPDKWVYTLSRGDMFFAKNNCKGFDRDFGEGVQFPEIYNSSATTYPIPRGLSVDSRFELTVKRDIKSKREIVKKYTLVVLFRKTSNSVIRLTPKAESNKLYIIVDSMTFMAKCYMSDMLMDNIDILGIPNGNAPMYEWEVL